MTGVQTCALPISGLPDNWYVYASAGRVPVCIGIDCQGKPERPDAGFAPYVSSPSDCPFGDYLYSTDRYIFTEFICIKFL